MALYIAKRTGIALLLIWLVATLVFLVLHIVPGDPAELLLSHGGVAPDPGTVAELREQLGLNKPISAQYLAYLGGLLQGDLGRSLQDGHSVSEEVALRLPRTLELIAVAILLASVTGIPLGTLAALRAGSRLDGALSVAAGMALSVPVFVIGTLAVLVFAQKLHLVPAGGYVPFAVDPLRHATLVLMPAGTMAVSLWAVVLRMTRSSVLEVLERDFVRAVRAKGVAPGRIVIAHVLRNALIPVVTVIGLHAGTLLGSTVLIEFVFNWPGLSGYLVRAVEARDYPEVVGIVLVISFLFIFLNLLIDLLYAVLDPRVRHAA
jgi:peptide/nickel transport system permease protein